MYTKQQLQKFYDSGEYERYVRLAFSADGPLASGGDFYSKNEAKNIRHRGHVLSITPKWSHRLSGDNAEWKLAADYVLRVIR